MSTFKQKIITTAVTALFASGAVWAAPELNVTLSSNTMTVSASASDHMYVSIAGPNGYRKALKGTDATQWNLGADAPDGLYRYDSYTTVNPSKDNLSTQDLERAMEQNSFQKSGTFSIKNGVIIQDTESDATNPEGEKQHNSQNTNGLLHNIFTSILDALVPVASAADLTASSGNPTVFFQDSTSSGGEDWAIIAHEFTAGDGEYLVLDRLGGNNNVVFKIEGISGSTNNTSSIVVDDNGDMSLVNSRVFIDRNINRVGIGTTTPAGSLHITDASFPEIILQNVGGVAWELEALTTSFNINDGNIRMFKVEQGASNNSLVVDSTSNIGIGTSSPAASLHVRKTDGSTKLLVEEVSATTAKRYLLEMKNNGATGFQLTDTSNSKSWQFAQTGSGGFTASQIGSGGPEFTVTNEGRVRMGPGSITNFDLQASGDLVIANGSVTANGILLTSSRASKTDIDAIKPAEIMEKLKKVEVAEWRYKKADKNDRHISPMAEDFYSLFQLGPDNKHINPNDLASVAIIAAKELQKEAATLKAENKALKKQLEEKTMALELKLKTENEALQKRLASLEKLVTNLASTNGHLKSSGAKVALK